MYLVLIEVPHSKESVDECVTVNRRVVLHLQFDVFNTFIDLNSTSSQDHLQAVDDTPVDLHTKHD